MSLELFGNALPRAYGFIFFNETWKNGRYK